VSIILLVHVFTGIGWSSGAVFNDDSIKELQQREKERLEAVRNDPDNPLVRTAE
jgi:hypothetical protein